MSRSPTQDTVRIRVSELIHSPSHSVDYLVFQYASIRKPSANKHDGLSLGALLFLRLIANIVVLLQEVANVETGNNGRRHCRNNDNGNSVTALCGPGSTWCGDCTATGLRMGSQHVACYRDDYLASSMVS
jgi:hypothetical protein